jgi:hypothetical protein
MTEEPGISAGLQFAANLSASIDGLASQLKAASERDRQCRASIWTFRVPPVPMTLTAGAGSLGSAMMFGPRTGQFWSIHYMVASGFTAGTVSVYLNSANGDLIYGFPSAGSATFGKGQMFLQPGDRFHFSATGITGTVAISFGGVQMLSEYVGDYLI